MTTTLTKHLLRTYSVCFCCSNVTIVVTVEFSIDCTAPVDGTVPTTSPVVLYSCRVANWGENIEYSVRE